MSYAKNYFAFLEFPKLEMDFPGSELYASENEVPSAPRADETCAHGQRGGAVHSHYFCDVGLGANRWVMPGERRITRGCPSHEASKLRSVVRLSNP